ncbi:MAG: N-acetyltransferase [Rubritepida sp.]|nr:N-acetyltransferase [Rubritepida sp.]
MKSEAILGEAFAADPLMTHAFGADAAAAGIARLLAPAVAACRRHGGVLAEDGAAAAWLPGALVPLPWGAWLRAGFGGLALALPLATLLRLQRHEATCEAAIRARFGPDRFGYLWLLGVVPAARGHGVGRRIVTSVLGAMAGKLDLCVLKTENPSSARFYAQLGFAVHDRFRVPASGLEVQVLARTLRI